jgi:hypothetical protein
MPILGVKWDVSRAEQNHPHRSRLLYVQPLRRRSTDGPTPQGGNVSRDGTAHGGGRLLPVFGNGVAWRVVENVVLRWTG